MQASNQISDDEITLTFSHPKFGERNIPAYKHQSLNEYRTALDLSSQTYLFTNYHFQHKGIRLNEFCEISQVIDQKAAKIDIVFVPFQYRSAKHHLYSFMEVIFNPQFYLFLTRDLPMREELNKLEAQSKTIPTNFNLDMENLKPDLSSPILVAQSEVQKKVQLLHSICLSGFNPAPQNQKLSGDLFYIFARTLEGQDIHITASPGGFFVNQSKISAFNPHKSTTYKQTYGSLIDLFKSVSDKFRQNLQNYLAETKLTQAMKYKFFSVRSIFKDRWLENAELQHGWNQRKNFVDQHIKLSLFSVKDWNQIFQCSNPILAQGSRHQINDHFVGQLGTFYKLYSDFEKAAIEGATCLVDGKISALNPTDDKKKHIYIYNKIFFSIANQTVFDHSLQKGEDATPSSSSINTDLKNIQTLFRLNIPQIHILHMVVINYRGYKVIAQCIIPGILTIDQVNCSQYGSIDDGKTVQNNPQFEKLMIQVCQKLGLEDNIQVVDSEGVKKRIAGSPDIKGILGTDKRKYILDLLRLSPRDLNYEGIQNQTCIIRPQLLKSFKKFKGTQKLPKLNTNIGTQLKFQKDEKYQEQLNLLKQIAAFLRKNAIDNVIDLLKNYPSQYLTNNEGITRAFHSNGVNMRYLGEVCKHESIKNEPQIKLVLERAIAVRSIKHVLRMAMRQSNIMHLGATIINILNCLFGRKVHILYMEQGMIETEQVKDKNIDKDAKKKKKKKNKQMNEPFTQIDLTQIINVIKIPQNQYVSMKPQQVWKLVCKIAKARFNYELPKSQLEFEPFKFPFQKIATLRQVCLSVGLVLERKNYDIIEGAQTNASTNNDKSLPFNCRNIIDIVPRPKRMNIQPGNLYERERQNEKLIQKYQVREALKFDSQLQKQNVTITGGMNDIAIKLYSRMGRILYILGQNKSAITQQQKNLSMLENLHCQDHWLNIQTHINLGLYYIANNDKNRVIYYIMKGIYLMLINFGQTSPDLLVSLANLARIYQMNKQYKDAIKCYKVAMKFIEQVHGKFHVKMSFCYTSLATIYYEIADLKSAIEHQTENVAILNKILPQNDMKFQDAIKILKMYHQLYQKSQLQNSYMSMMLNMNQMETKKMEEQKEAKKKSKKH